MLEVLEFSGAPGTPTSQMVRVAPVRPLASLAVFNGKLPALEAALGVALPGAGHTLAVGEALYLWSGPGNWLVWGADIAQLANATHGLAALVEQTDGRVVLEVSGANATACLAKLVPIDLDEREFAVGMTALTLAGHVNVQIWRAAEQVFALACLRSFADCLYASLIEAARAFASAFASAFEGQ